MASPQFPFYFAWVDGTETTFGPEHQVVDENLFDFTIDHLEGQHPTLSLTIRNPRIGLLNASRKQWAWFSYQKDDTTVVPLFFGVLIGMPTDLFQELITLKFVSRSLTYIEDKQAVAEAMKIRPYYDPIWISETKRDDPDSILEGWSALWHVDRTTLVTTASDILDGEDGTVVFDESKAYYDSVSVQIGQAPLNNVRVEASVKWSQRAIGYMTGPSMDLSSYTGDSLISDWPKPGASLGSGWRVASSFVVDKYNVANTPTITSNWHYENTHKTHANCDIISSEQNASAPVLFSPDVISGELTGHVQFGVCDPFSDPPTNTPATVQANGVIVPLWNIAASMTLRYDAKRLYRETIQFDLLAETQSILTSPDVSQNTELLSIQPADVGVPLTTFEAWSNFAGQSVALGEVIFPNDPTKPGGLSYQICVEAGVAGAEEPDFSDTPGDVTVDGTVYWASLGTSPPSTSGDWIEAAFTPLGQIICFQEKLFDNAMGAWINTGRSSYYLCTQAGQTNRVFEQFNYTPAPTNNDMPTPAVVTIAYIRRPDFVAGYQTAVADGSVIWTSLGASPSLLQMPIGGTPDNVTARCYFPTDRGQQSVEALICKARARLRLRARAVTVGWECKLDDALDLSCRKSATLFDPRLPGGSATGKVINYSLKGNGDTGDIGAKVEIGCSVGHDGHVASEPGVGCYASTGYMQTGYQQNIGETKVLPESDISYSPLRFTPFDDGLSFPLDLRQVCENPKGTRSGTTLADQRAAFLAAIDVSRQIQNLGSGSNPTAAWTIEQVQLRLAPQALPYVMAANPISWTCYLKPVTNGPFNGAYFLNVSTLQVPRGIDLEAASSP